MLRFSGTGATDAGLVRDHNEDSAFVGPRLLLVADGVGGGAAGEVASATTAYVVSASVNAAPSDQPPAQVLAGAVRVAQEQLAVGVARDETRAGMATTLTAVLTDGRTCWLAHLGDSRGYLLRDSRLVRITRDHTFVQDMIDDGRLTEAEARSHPWRNVVMRTVHGDPAVLADVVELPLEPGDRLLVASDGLTDLVPEPRIAEILAGHHDDEAVGALVRAALAAGGHDNVTCVVATLIDGPPVSLDGQLLGAVRDPANIVDASAIRSAHPA